MTGLLVLLLLAAFRRGGAPGAHPTVVYTGPAQPAPRVPASTPTAVTPVQATPATPEAKPVTGYGAAPGTRPPGGPWRAYAPMHPAVVSQAQQVLRSGALNFLGPDPQRPGKRVYYQREFNRSTGKTSVTAWQQTS